MGRGDNDTIGIVNKINGSNRKAGQMPCGYQPGRAGCIRKPHAVAQHAIDKCNETWRGNRIARAVMIDLIGAYSHKEKISEPPIHFCAKVRQNAGDS